MKAEQKDPLHNAVFWDLETYPNCFRCIVKANGIFTVIDSPQGAVEYLENVPEDAILVSFNGIGFDHQIMNKVRKRVEVSEMVGSEDVYEMVEDIIVRKKRIYDQQTVLQHSSWIPAKILDIQELLNCKCSLKRLLAATGFWNVEDLPFEPGKALTKPEKKKLTEYGKNDVSGLEFLYVKYAIQNEMRSRSFLSERFDVDVFTLGRPRVALAIANDQCEKKTGKRLSEVRQGEYKGFPLPFKDTIVSRDLKKSFFRPPFDKLYDKLTSFTRVDRKPFKCRIDNGFLSFDFGEGGGHSYHAEPRYFESNSRRRYFELDGKSYYPHILKIFGIFPKFRGFDLSKMFCDTLDDRLNFQAEGNKSFADDLKIILNAFGGLYGEGMNVLSNKANFYRMTIQGQLLLVLLLQHCEKHDMTVEYLNTDGIVVSCLHTQVEKLNAIAENWSKQTKIPLHLVPIKRMWNRNANCVLWEFEDGKLKKKKEFANFTYVGLWSSGAWKNPIVAMAARAYLMQGTPIEDTVKNGATSIMDYCRITSATRDRKTREYTKKCLYLPSGEVVELNKTVRFYYSTSGSALKTHFPDGRIIQVAGATSVSVANTIEDFDPKKFTNIDFDYYIAEAKKIVAGFPAPEPVNDLPFD